MKIYKNIRIIAEGPSQLNWEVSPSNTKFGTVEIAYKDDSDVNINLGSINSERILFADGISIGAGTLDWIENQENLPFLIIENRKIKYPNELTHRYQGVLNFLETLGYNIEPWKVFDSTFDNTFS